MQYHYKAVDAAGKIREDNIEAASIAEVLKFIAKESLKPLSVQPVVAPQVIFKAFGPFGKITLEDKLFLTKYLSLMLKVGTDPFKAIEILLQDVEKPALKQFLFELRGNMEKGNQFYVAFANHPDLFSPVVVNLIKAAETSGNLEKTLAEVSDSYSKEAELKGKIRAALIYPVLLLIAATGIVITLVTFVLPRIATVFTSSGARIPTYSRVVLAVGLFLSRYLGVILVPFIAALVGSWYFFFKTERGRAALYNIADHLPAVKDLVRKTALERFARTLSSLLKAGVPILEALDIAAETIGHEEFKAALFRISRENVARGVSIGDAFRKEQVFPKVVVNLMVVGEKTGHIEEILTTLAKFYEGEIDVALKTLVSFLEPALLVGIGIIVAVIALSVIVPIYQLVGQY